jgi:hypothetical protein
LPHICPLYNFRPFFTGDAMSLKALALSKAEKIQQLKMLLQSPQKRLLILSYIGSGLSGAQLEISKRIIFMELI